MLYELGHLAIFLIVYGIAALTPSYRALLLLSGVCAIVGVIGGQAVLDWRESLPGHGGWDSLGDALLAILLGFCVLFALLIQALRIRLQRRGSELALLVQIAGLFVAPALGFGAFLSLGAFG